MTPIDTSLQGLKRNHPEWEPWLAVIQEVMTENTNLEWDSAVPALIGAQPGKVPLLAEATLVFAAGPVRRFLERLMRIACHSGTAKMAALEPTLRAELDGFDLFKASLCQDRDHIKQIAANIGADAEAFQAVIDLLPLPFLQACYRRWAASIPESWMEGYCPACGSWPAFAEVRGIERSRYLRCGRCGAAWQAHCLFCPYCGITDHEELVSLVPERSGSNSVIEACTRCLGYIKSFTLLQGSPPAKVLLDDLASVDLDVAAVEQGYRRPQGAGYALAVNVIETGVTGSLVA